MPYRPPFRLVCSGSPASPDGCRVVVSANAAFDRGSGWPNALSIEILAQCCAVLRRARGPEAGGPPAIALAAVEDARFAGRWLPAGRYQTRWTDVANWGSLRKVRGELIDEAGSTVAEATLTLSGA